MASADSTAPKDIHQVVIIGASFGGIPAAHGLLKDVFPALSASRHQKYRIVLIAPNDHFYWKIGAPRMIVKPDVLPLEKVLLPIAEGFKQYPKDQYEFILAYATSVDPDAKTVSTSTNQNIRYDSLVIASGTTFATSVWTTSNGLDALRADLAELHQKLPSASSILVAGGGAVGTETSGELGELYGGKKELTLLSGSTQLLPRLNNKAIGKDAEARLTKLGVTVVHNVRVTSWSKTPDNKTSLKLSDGTERNVDAYIEATGDRPNSNFVPEAWLNSKGLVKTDGATLRVDVPDVQNVYCVGSVGSYSDGSAFDTKFAMKALLESIRLDLIGKRETSPSSIASLDPTSPGWISWLTTWIPFYGSTESGKRKIFYKKIQSDTQLIPIGAKQGVGIGFGWKLPSFAIVMAKGKDYMISNGPKLVGGTGWI
jgi:apoptosis-inducing factor 2